MNQLSIKSPALAILAWADLAAFLSWLSVLAPSSTTKGFKIPILDSTVIKASPFFNHHYVLKGCLCAIFLLANAYAESEGPWQIWADRVRIAIQAGFA